LQDNLKLFQFIALTALFGKDYLLKGHFCFW